MSILFAYDGSMGDDWVSHYAVRLAARHPSAAFQLLHVQDRQVADADLTSRADCIKQECETAGVAFDSANRSRRRPDRDATRFVPKMSEY